MRKIVLAIALAAAIGACKSEEEKEAAQALNQLAGAATKALLGDNVAPELRDRIAKTAAKIAEEKLKNLGKDLDGLVAKGLSSGSAPGALPGKPAAPALSPAEEAALVAKIDLGAKDDPFPAELKGLKFGMGASALQGIRPNARVGRPFASTRKGQPETRLVALEDGSPEGPYAKFSYHFENDRLTAVFATLRATTLSPALLAKAKAKWGVWRDDLFARKMEEFYAKRGGGMKEWKLPAGRVKLEQNGIEPQARFYFSSR